MINVCFHCGQYRSDKIIGKNGLSVICPECGHEMKFLQLPLFIVSGASGTGKSTICYDLLGKTEDVVILDSDILWQEEFNKPENNYRNYFEMWLRVSKNISQSGRPVVLFGSGLGVPENIEPCMERRYFSKIFYLELYCSDDILERRLRERPQWRKSSNEKFIESQKEYNNWIKEYGNKGGQNIEIIDTTNKTIKETSMEVLEWIKKRHITGLFTLPLSD